MYGVGLCKLQDCLQLHFLRSHILCCQEELLRYDSEFRLISEINSPFNFSRLFVISVIIVCLRSCFCVPVACIHDHSFYSGLMERLNM